MITPTTLERWGYTAVFGSVALVMLFAAAANVLAGTTHDAVGLLLSGGLMLAPPWIRWTRFLSVAESGITYRNWAVVRVVPWTELEGFRVRLLLHPRSRAWAVVAERRDRRGVTLRATARPGSYNAARDRAALALVTGFAAALEDARQ